MSVYTYNGLVKKAEECYKNVNTKYKLDMTDKWSYYFAKAVLNPHKDIKRIAFGDNPSPKQDKISRQASKKEYIHLAKKLTLFVEKKGRLPDYVNYGDFKLSPRLLTYTFSKILIRYNKNGKLQSEVTLANKVFTKPLETHNEVYKYFTKVFGPIASIDEALKKVMDKGYSYYYDDRYSNKESIDRIRKGQGVNCTDSCQVFYNITSALIDLGKYKKVECLHVQCSTGGHVKLRITKKDGTRFIRDPACVLSNNGKGVTCVWCTNTGTINPSWFMMNLNR
jgi:hypothetical protein